MNKNTKKIIFWLLFIVWLASYYLTNFVVYIPWSTFIIVPIIFLAFILFLGSSLYRGRFVWLMVGSLLILILAVFARSLYYFSIDTEQKAIFRSIGLGLSMYFCLYLLTHLLIIGIYAFCFYKKKLSFVKSFGFGLLAYGLIIFSVFAYFIFLNQSLNVKLCSPDTKAEGYYASLFFLHPITKTELQSIIKKNDFNLQFITLTSQKDLNRRYTFQFVPFINSSTIISPLIDNMKASTQYWSQFGDGSMNDPSTSLDTAIVNSWNPPDESERMNFGPLLDEYENNEPVVWYVQFYEPPMGVMTALAHDLDVNQKNLGVDLKAWPFGTDPHSIQPATWSHPVSQASCYRFLK